MRAIRPTVPSFPRKRKVEENFGRRFRWITLVDHSIPRILTWLGQVKRLRYERISKQEGSGWRFLSSFHPSTFELIVGKIVGPDLSIAISQRICYVTRIPCRDGRRIDLFSPARKFRLQSCSEKTRITFASNCCESCPAYASYDIIDAWRFVKRKKRERERERKEKGCFG